MIHFLLSFFIFILLCSSALARDIYFAAEGPPVNNIPPEAPLCYKFQVSNLEEQLGKLKAKYGNALYDEKIVDNDDESRTLLAKRKDKSGKEIQYFYSNSPKICNKYQQTRLGHKQSDSVISSPTVTSLSTENQPEKPHESTAADVSSQPQEPSKEFTIVKIEPDVGFRKVEITLSGRFCVLSAFQNNLKLLPPAKIDWGQSELLDDKLILRGSFRQNTSYQIKLPQEFSCNAYHYKETLKKFYMPRRPPIIGYVLDGTVIERNSRQMLHAKVQHVENLIFEGYRIPLFLVLHVINQLKNEKISFENIQSMVETKNTALKAKIANIPELKPFISDVYYEKQLFFPENSSDKPIFFSLPLNFRKDKEKGSLELVQFSSKTDSVKSKIKLFRITDMGLTYKLSDKSLLIWVTSLNTGKPLKDVSIFGFNQKDEVVILGKTDWDGILLVKAGDSKKQVSLNDGTEQNIALNLSSLILLGAASSDDLTYMEIVKDGNIKPDWIPMKAEGETPQFLKAHVFTERGIYQPGEVVYFKGTIREYHDGAIKPPQGVEPEIVITDAKGDEAYCRKLKLTDFGTFWDYFDTKSNSPFGAYTIDVICKEQVQTSHTFQVQEIRAPRHFVTIQCKHETEPDNSYVNLKRDAHLLKCNVSGRYYVGGPVLQGKLRWKIYLTGTDFNIPGYSDFTFGHVLKQTHKDLLETGESMLDKKGELTVTVPLSTEVLNGVYGLEVAATVVDFDGRAASETTTYQEEPPFKVGISQHEEEILPENPQRLSLIVLDKNNKKIKTGTLDVQVMERDWITVQKRNDEGNTYWSSSMVWRPHLTTTLPIKDGTAFFNIDFSFIDYYDEYILKFTYAPEEGKAYASTTYYMVGSRDYYDYYERAREKGERRFEELLISSDKKNYAPGEEVKLLLNPQKKISSILMTIEREDLFQYKVITEKSYQYKELTVLKAQQSHGPNIYVTLLGTVGRTDFPVNNLLLDQHKPTFLYGAVNVNVNNKPEELTVKINEKDKELKFEPAQEVKLQIAVTDKEGKGIESEVALAVVDESVLSLTRFQTPTLYDLTRFTIPLSVYTGEIRSDILNQTPFRFILMPPLTGGGGMENLQGSESGSIKFRKDFRAVAYYNPALLTDSSGQAEAYFTLPDSMTQFRVYAVAVDKTAQFASYEKPLVAVKDFYLEPGIPEFFTKGDQFTFLVAAFNKTREDGSVNFSVNQTPNVSLTAKAKLYKIKAMDQVMIPVQGSALDSGQGKLSFVANMGQHQDAVEKSIPVNSGHLLWNELKTGKIEGGGIQNRIKKFFNLKTDKGETTVTYRFPESVTVSELPIDEVKIYLTVSGSPFFKLAKGLTYLLHYPYGCVEQTSSGVLPLAGLRGLIREGLIPNITTKDTDKFLQKGIKRLLSMQTESGGFGYWPGAISDHPWGTVYALIALSFAREAGYSVDEHAMTMAMKYLQDEMKNQNITYKAFAAFILSMNKSLKEKTFRELYQINVRIRNLNNMPKMAALLVLMAGKRGGYVPEEELARETELALNRTDSNQSYTPFYARFLRNAISLMAASELIPDRPITGNIAAPLLDGMNPYGYWTSTSDTGWTLVALGTYFRGTSFSHGSVTVTLEQEGQPQLKQNITPKVAHTFMIDPKAFLADPKITLKATATVMYQLSVTYPRLDFAKDGFSNKFKISKTIENTNGTDTIKVGDVVEVSLNLTLGSGYRNRYEYIVLDDPLPAGFVAINSAISSEEQVGNDDDEDDYEYWSYWDSQYNAFKFTPDYFEMRDDRVLAFRDHVWGGDYYYKYYARAVCEGEFVLPSSKIQLMYSPDTVAYTPQSRVVIVGR